MNRLNAQIAELTELLALERASSGEVTDNLATLRGEPVRRRDRARPAPRPARQPVGRGQLGRRPGRPAHRPARGQEAGQPARARPGRTAQPADLGAPPPDRRARGCARRLGGPRPREPDQDRRSRPAAQRRPRPARPGAVALPVRLLRPACARSSATGRISASSATASSSSPRCSSTPAPTRSAPRAWRNSTSSPRRSSSSTRRSRQDIPWVLRIDGHTDKRPITNPDGRFRTNWDLSAARAISVVQHLIADGVPAERLVAAGFGEIPADRGRRYRGGLRQEPPDRAQADRALSAVRRRRRLALVVWAELRYILAPTARAASPFSRFPKALRP